MTEQTHYPDWQKLTPLPDKPRPDEKIGAKFVVVNDGNWHLNQGDIVELVENDGTSAPYFKRINEDRMHPCNWERLALLPQPEEKKVKKIIPFTDEFDWCEEGVLVIIEGRHERYAVRAKGDSVWTVNDGFKLCEIENTGYLSTRERSDCQKVIHEAHRPLTNREFAEFLQDNKGMVKYATDSIIYYKFLCYDYERENDDAHEALLFRFRGTEEWYPATAELYEIANGLDV